MLYLAICDDDIHDLSSMSNLLNQYKTEKGVAIQYDAFTNALDLLDAMKTRPYHVLLLDVFMPGLNGIEAAREIRRTGNAVKIVFLTSSKEFAVESYAVDAHYYLLKPGTAETVYPLLDKLVQDALRSEDELIVRSPNGILRLAFSRLEFLEVRSKKLLFYLSDGSVHELNGSLLEYEPRLLCRAEFAKVHRSYIVNLENIRSLNKQTLTTYAQREVPVSRLLCNQVREAYMQYLFLEKGVF